MPPHGARHCQPPCHPIPRFLLAAGLLASLLLLVWGSLVDPAAADTAPARTESSVSDVDTLAAAETEDVAEPPSVPTAENAIGTPSDDAVAARALPTTPLPPSADTVAPTDAVLPPPSVVQAMAVVPSEPSALADAVILAVEVEPAAAPVTAAAVIAPPAAGQCNGTDNVGGQAVACDVTITNNLDVATGVTSSTVTVDECHGAANAALPCTTTTTPSDQLVTSVDQCNGSGNGGGGTVTCNVRIINNITGAAITPTPATVNQCNEAGTGGGTQPTTACSPFPANTTNATVEQCNSSGTGGGGTMRVRCTVLPSTQTSLIPVSVDQCNGSGNGVAAPSPARSR